MLGCDLLINQSGLNDQVISFTHLIDDLLCVFAAASVHLRQLLLNGEELLLQHRDSVRVRVWRTESGHGSDSWNPASGTASCQTRFEVYNEEVRKMFISHDPVGMHAHKKLNCWALYKILLVKKMVVYSTGWIGSGFDCWQP